MIKGFLYVCILIAIATEKTRLRSVKPLQKSRVLPGQPTANQNPYSGYALPPGIYTAPAYGTYGKYDYGPRAGPNPGAAGMNMGYSSNYPNSVPPASNPNPPGAAPNAYSPNYPNQFPTLNPNPAVPMSPTPNNYGYQPNYQSNQYTPSPTSPNNPNLTNYPSQPLPQTSIESTINMGYPPNSPNSQIPGSFEHNQVGAASLITTSPPKEVKHGTSTGIYLAMLLILPCTIGGCCIARMFFTPKQGLYYPEPLMFAENASHLSFPAGASYSQNPTRSNSMRADMGASRSYDDRRPSHHSDHRYPDQDRRPSHHSEHRHSHYSTADPHFETPGNLETPYEPVYDYGGTPVGNKGRMI